MITARVRFAIILLLLVFSVFLKWTAHAESYVAGFAGYGLSAELSSVRGAGDLAGFTGSNLGLQNSPIYGLKAGHFLNNLKYFGGEMELYSATPFLKQQQFTVSGPSGSATATIPGVHQRVTTAAFNVIYRYPGQMIQPYAGAGLGFFWFTTPSSTAGSEIRAGLNILGGVRVLVTQQIAVFGEYKYNHSSFPAGGDVTANYNAHFAVFGMGYHF